jgi:hypothetical protein
MSLEQMSDDEIFRVANPIMDNLMDASTLMIMNGTFEISAIG